MSRKQFFSEWDIYNVIEGQKESVKKEVYSLDSNYLLNVSEEDLVAALVEKLKLDVPKLLDKQIYVYDSGEAKIDISRDPNRYFIDRTSPYYVTGNKTTISVPFEGDIDFFKIRPTTWSTGGNPNGEIVGNEIRLNYEQFEVNSDALKGQYEKAISDIKQRLEWLDNDVRVFNNSIEQIIRQHISERKSKLLASNNMIASLGLPVRKRDGVSETYALPVNRSKTRFEMPKTTSKAFVPEPILPNADYENILSITKNMVLVMEKSPKAFEQMDEEALRTHFLVQLNGQYEGSATGETFNNKGKTDILITEKGKNVFIGECKFWKGESVFLETIDQLLSYSSWRDTKTAILIFNRNKNFTDVLNTIENAVPKHTCYKRFIKKIDETTFQYIFHQPQDTNREMTITIMAFNVPSKS